MYFFFFLRSLLLSFVALLYCGRLLKNYYGSYKFNSYNRIVMDIYNRSVKTIFQVFEVLKELQNELYYAIRWGISAVKFHNQLYLTTTDGKVSQIAILRTSSSTCVVIGAATSYCTESLFSEN